MGGAGDNSVKPGSERQRSHVFSHMWIIDPNDEHIHKYKYDCIYTDRHTQRKNMFPEMELFDKTGGRRERKREQQRMKNIELNQICVSTRDNETPKTVEQYGVGGKV
jgi:hypothetical protein